MKTLRFSLTAEEYHLVIYQAAARGLTPSAYAKTALFSHIDKYPSKGLMSSVARNTLGEQKTP